MTVKNLQFLNNVENRDTFFQRVHTFVLPYHRDALLIAKAYQMSKDAFRGVKRKRGERYFEHCRATALILIEVFGIRDPEMIIAALLHDIIEDCGWTREQIATEFGNKVGFLVDGVSMPEGNFVNREERISAYHQKFLTAMTFDDRVLFIKLADRLHNLFTCEAMSFERQLRMIDETEALYIPLAKEKGIHSHDLLAVIQERKENMMDPTDT